MTLVALLILAALVIAASAPSHAATPSPGPKLPPQDTVAVNAQTASIIHGGLKWLAACQTPTGSFYASQHQAAFTGYALMAFMSAGELPGEGEFGKNVNSGMRFLLSCVQPDGYIAAPGSLSNMYGHGIAATALAELYGQTRDATVRPKLALAIKLIINCQGPQGGWRYTPRVNPDADISVTVLQLVALRAAKNAGIDVPQTTIDRAVAFVRSCHDDDGGFHYRPETNEPGFARTAAAIYSLQVCGLYDDPMIKPASTYLFDHIDDYTEWWTYGNFYAAPAQYMIGGDTWTKWYTKVNQRLVTSAQPEAGGMFYWTPPPGDRSPNTVYCTSVFTMILAMPYHYIPLYQR